MIKFITGLGIVILLVACSTQEVLAAKYGMKCGSVWINNGDTILKVLNNCGVPLLKTETIDQKGNTLTRILYTKYGVTYKVTLRNDAVLLVTRTK